MAETASKPKVDMKKLHPMLRSKLQMYEEPPKPIADAQESTKKRLIDRKKELERIQQQTPQDERIERDKQETLIGQLKAAEARNRLRIMRLRYQTNREREIRHLISCQPTALRAVRLEALLPRKLFHENEDDTLNKAQRERVEYLLDNDMKAGALF